MRAIVRSWAKVPQEKISSREEISERMEPVRTQMKLYGIKPGGGTTAVGLVFLPLFARVCVVVCVLV